MGRPLGDTSGIQPRAGRNVRVDHENDNELLLGGCERAPASLRVSCSQSAGRRLLPRAVVARMQSTATLSLVQAMDASHGHAPSPSMDVSHGMEASS